jgi:hypothetical protein
LEDFLKRILKLKSGVTPKEHIKKYKLIGLVHLLLKMDSINEPLGVSCAVYVLRLI